MFLWYKHEPTTLQRTTVLELIENHDGDSVVELQVLKYIFTETCFLHIMTGRGYIISFTSSFYTEISHHTGQFLTQTKWRSVAWSCARTEVRGVGSASHGETFWARMLTHKYQRLITRETLQWFLASSFFLSLSFNMSSAGPCLWSWWRFLSWQHLCLGRSPEQAPQWDVWVRETEDSEQIKRGDKLMAS